MNSTFVSKCRQALRIVILCGLVLPWMASRPTRAAGSLFPQGSIMENPAAIEDPVGTFTRSAASSNASLQIFLPIIINPAPVPLNLVGRVTFNGVSASGVKLILMLYEGSNYPSGVASTNTAADGSYLFTADPLSAGQSYRVYYSGTALAEGKLDYWYTTFLATYESGQITKRGDFDIADVPLVSPVGAATIALPTTFQWDRRQATPGDSYRFELDNGYSLCHVFSSWLGYVNSYTLDSTVEGCDNTGFQNYWTVYVSDGDGGIGRSYFYNSFKFSK